MIYDIDSGRPKMHLHQELAFAVIVLVLANVTTAIILKKWMKV